MNPCKNLTDYEFWICADGRVMRPREMTIWHLRNAISLIDRKHGWRKRWREPLFRELASRTEEVQF